MPFSKLQTVSSWKEIEDCSSPPAIDWCQIRIAPQMQGDQVVGYGVQCFKGIGSAFSQDYAVSFNPKLSEYNASVPFLQQGQYTEICKMGKKAKDGSYTLFSTYPLASAFMQQMSTSGTPTAATGLFNPCDPMLDAYKANLNFPLTQEIALYLAGKFPNASGGCSSMQADGAIFYSFSINDAGAIDIAIRNISNDIAQNRLPAGLTADAAWNLADELERFKRENVVSVVQMDATKETLSAQREALVWTAVLTVGSTVGMAALFLYLNRKQMKFQQALMEGKLGVVKNALALYTDDMGEMYRSGELEPMDPKIRLSQIKDVLIRLKARKSTALTGMAGVGKTAVVEGLAALFEQVKAAVAANGRAAVQNLRAMLGDETYELIKKMGPRFKFRSLNINRLVAGTKNRGDFEARLEAVLDEIKASKKNGITEVLVIDELHRFVGMGSAEGITGGDQALKPALARGEVQAIGMTTKEEFNKHIASDRALARRFAEVDIPPLLMQETVDALMAKVAKIGAATDMDPQLQIPRETVQEAVRLAVEFTNDQALPGSAADILENAAEYKRAYPGTDPAKADILTPEDVRRYVENKYQISIGSGDDDDQNPPAAPTGGESAPVASPEADGSQSHKASAIDPYVLVPTPASGSRLVLDPTMAPKLVAAMRQAVVHKPLLVTPEGFLFSSSVDPIFNADMTVETASGTKRVIIPTGTGTGLSGGAAFGANAAAGLMGGAAALLMIEDYEARTGRQMPWWGEGLTFLGTGLGLSATQTLLSGGALSASELALSVPYGIPASVLGFTAVSKYGSAVGIPAGSREGRWFTVGAGSVLVAAGLSAEVGGTSAATLGLTWAGVTAGIGATAGWGLALLGGGAVGLGLDHGTGWLMHATGACEEWQDCSISGRLSDWMIDNF